MSSLASTIVGWLLPSRLNARSLMCQGTARQIARRFVAVLGLQEGYHAAVLQQHLVMVVDALRVARYPVTRFNVVRFAYPHGLEGLCVRLQRLHIEADWLEEYLVDLKADRDRYRTITCSQAHLAAKFELADAPASQRGTFRQAARTVGDLLVNLLLEACFVLVWGMTTVIYSGVFWAAFELLGSSISLKQSLGLGLLVTFFLNELTGRTDALAKRVVCSITSRL